MLYHIKPTHTHIYSLRCHSFLAVRDVLCPRLQGQEMGSVGKSVVPVVRVAPRRARHRRSRPGAVTRQS
jgi:hypothetical protein